MPGGIRVIGVPGENPGGGLIGVGVNAPPADTPPGAAACACAGLTVAWFNGTQFAVSLSTDEAEPSFAIDGTICPDTTYLVSPSWDPDGSGDSPTVRQFGASAWAIDGATAAGILTVSVIANCAGASITVGTIFLTVVLGEYYAPPGGDCVAPTEYTSLLTMITAGCAAVNYEGAGSDRYIESGTDWFVSPFLPFYANLAGTISGATGAQISFVGLQHLFGSSDMMVRITITDGSLTAGAYPFYLDNKNDLTDFPLTPGTSWEYTIPNSDIDTWVTGMGTGDGAGDPNGGDYLQFRIEVKAV